MLKEIVLRNVCQHRDVQVKLGPGLTVVVGRQGSGKTNLFGMPEFTLTGKSRLSGTKDENISFGSGNEPSYASSTWEVGSTTFTVTRAFQKFKSSIQINGVLQDAIRRETEITAKCEELLGVSAANIQRFSFVEQGRTDAVFQQQETDRVKFAAELLGVSEILQWGTKVSQAQTQLSGMLLTDYRRDLQAEIARRHMLWKSYCELNRAQQQAIKTQEYLVGEVAKYAKLAQQKDFVEGLREKARLLKAKHDDEEANLKKAKGDLEKANSDLEKTKGELEQNRKYASLLKARGKHTLATAKLTSLRHDLRTAEADLVAPEEPKFADIDEKAYSELIGNLAGYTRDISLRRKNLAQCPTCGKEIDVTTVSTAELESAHAAALASKKSMEEARVAWSNYRAAKKTFDDKLESNTKRVADIQVRIAEYQAQLEEAAGVDFSSIPTGFTALTELVEKSREAAILQLTRRVGQLESEIKNSETALSQFKSDHGEVVAQIAVNEVSQSQLQAMQEVQGQLAAITESITSGQREVDKTLMEAKTVSGKIESLIQSYRAQRKAYAAKELLTSIEPLMRPKGIPQELLFHQMRQATSHMSSLCAELGQPFSIAIDDTLNFIATWPSGHVEPVTRLSMGQRACAATMFWVAKLLTSRGHALPLLVLDEPSANMDSDVVHQFGLMLQRLDRILVERKLQVVLITHHQQLASCGSYVCRLS